MSIRFVDELDDGFGWMETERLHRTSHALAVDGRVWLIDPIDGDGVEERVRALGEPAGVIQLIDRHNRDCAALAARLGVPLHVVPSSLPATPFRFLPVLRSRWWKEVALWWPERRILVCADALGTHPFFRVGDEPAGLHPFFRLKPPARAAGARRRAPARRSRRGHPRRGCRGRGRAGVADGPAPVPPLAGGDPAHHAQGVLAAVLAGARACRRRRPRPLARPRRATSRCRNE